MTRRPLPLFLLLGLTLGLMAVGCTAADTDSTDNADASDVSDASDAADAADSSDASDASDAADSSDVSDASDAADSSDASDASDAADSSDASDASDAADSSDASDASDAADSSDASDETDASDPSDTAGNDCGGIAGLTCDAGQVCDMSEYDVCGSDMMGTCVVPEEVMCTEQYEPVCGCDGVTYSNDCFRQAAYVAFSHDGECDVPEPDPYAGRPIGQCVTNADCQENNSNLTCSRTAPGGICNGCGVDADCPGSTVCNLGACAIECSSSNGQDDCPPGLYCLSSGKCGISWCTGDECAVPMFGCSASGRCARMECTAAMTCPENTTCVDDLCIEDRAL